MIDLAGLAIRNKTTTIVLTVMTFIAGITSFNNMSRLEDPEFTIKDALVITPYPGASAFEVSQEVSDEIEQAVQKLGQLDQVESKSERGLSTLTLTIKDRYDKHTLPQVWDEVRRKVNDAQSTLPPGAGPSIIIDDYGDVYGVFFAIYGDDYSYAELKDYIDLLKRELLLVEDVAKVETFGERTEVIYVKLNIDRISQLGLNMATVFQELQAKNIASYAGRVNVDNEYITIEPTGVIRSVDEIGNLYISANNQQIYLRDIAEITRGYKEPVGNGIMFNGRQAIGLGVSTVSGGNVVVMGEAIAKRLNELKSVTPLGMEFGVVSMQSEAVTVAIDGFISSLLQAVAIVVIVLLFFMGLRSGILIGFILALTIAGTFIFLPGMDVSLERISLGALIIALGMLVDNAIVVVDGMLVRMNRGEDPVDAAKKVVKQTAIPLLGATIVGILAFAAIGTSQDSTGEFCRSLFQVVLVSLLLSWVTGMTVTPLFATMFLKPEKNNANADPYASRFYVRYRTFLVGAIKRRWLTMSVVVVLFVTALQGFSYVDRTFFPSSTRAQVMVDVWLKQGAAIEETQRVSQEIESYLTGLEKSRNVTTFIGQGGLRFLLTYGPEKQSSSYMQFLVDVDDYRDIDAMAVQIEAEMSSLFPDTLAYVTKFQLGPGGNGKIQARFGGDDPSVIRQLSEQALQIFHDHPNTKAIRTDWRERVKVIRPVISEQQASLNGITRRDIAETLLIAFEGSTAGIYREGDLLLPIIVRSEEPFREDVNNIRNMQIWSPVSNTYVPIRQVVTRFETVFEDEIIVRRDRLPTITVFTDPIHGTASALFNELRPQIEAIPLPPGYHLEWGGEYEDSGNAQASLAEKIPVFVVMMILIVIALFNNLRQPLIIWLVVPLSLIGVTVGLLVTGQPFGFMALLGFLSLSGMLIKNAIVLIDEVNIQESEGKDTYSAVIMSGVSRLRPVAMAASTTALGMIPLLLDAFFAAMAVTIIFGLVFATVLTMVVIPVLYAILFRLQPPADAK